MLPKRYLHSHITSDLANRMVFIGGPRQVGKTTMALSLLSLSEKSNPAYFNWDVMRRRSQLMNAQFPSEAKLIVVDEVHKYPRWRNLMKGFYDEFFPGKSFLVTGSARLDYYRKGGDSLLGRYHYLRLHPLSPLEISTTPSADDLSALLKFGGFPEPLLKGSESFLRRWQNERASRVLREDLRDLEQVKEISLLELLLEALPQRVGSPLSIQSLREDLHVAHDTVSRWLLIFENLYLTFRIKPFSASGIRAQKKEQKLYLWDWSVHEDNGKRFENFMASCLLKYCHFLQDTEGFQMELRYLRDKEKREIDFIVIKDKKPIFAVECKAGQAELSRHIRYFAERTSIPKFYQVHLGSRDYQAPASRARVLPFVEFCRTVGIP